MSSAIVVDLGSSAVKCGLANSYLTDTQPSVVSTTSRDVSGGAVCGAVCSALEYADTIAC